MKESSQKVGGNESEDLKYNQRRARFLTEKLELAEEKLNLPFPISDGFMNVEKTADIRYHKNKQSDWTTAIRYMLIDCKQLITLQNNIDAYELIEL